MAYMLTIILIEAATVGEGLSAGDVCVQLLLQFGIGGIMGWLLGRAGVWLSRCYRNLGNARNEDFGQSAAALAIRRMRPRPLQ